MGRDIEYALLGLAEGLKGYTQGRERRMDRDARAQREDAARRNTWGLERYQQEQANERARLRRKAMLEDRAARQADAAAEAQAKDRGPVEQFLKNYGVSSDAGQSVALRYADEIGAGDYNGVLGRLDTLRGDLERQQAAAGELPAPPPRREEFDTNESFQAARQQWRAAQADRRIVPTDLDRQLGGIQETLNALQRAQRVQEYQMGQQQAVPGQPAPELTGQSAPGLTGQAVAQAAAATGADMPPRMPGTPQVAGDLLANPDAARDLPQGDAATPGDQQQIGAFMRNFAIAMGLVPGTPEEVTQAWSWFTDRTDVGEMPMDLQLQAQGMPQSDGWPPGMPMGGMGGLPGAFTAAPQGWYPMRQPTPQQPTPQQAGRADVPPMPSRDRNWRGSMGGGPL